jgi:hypothetical protein
MSTRSERRRTACRRRIAADPTSTALLLAGPSAMDLWPGVQRVASVEGGLVVETHLPSRPHAAATVRAFPPKRTPTSYVTRFTWEGPGLPATSGELTLSFLPDADGTVETEASLVLESDAAAVSSLDELTLRELAKGFLANLATAAELRSHAA